MLAVAVSGCGKSQTSPPATPTPLASASLVVTFGENPVPFRSTGCNASTPQGWYTSVRIQETAGVTFTPRTFTQKVDGTAPSFLAESFNSRFGPCPGGTFNESAIPANGAACGVAGVCTSSTFATYQFELAGTDANGHALTFTSPVLQLGAK
jgi:hypothetical protein